MGLINYARLGFPSAPAAVRPIVNKKMPVHDWLWENYGHDEHLVQYDTNPCSKQGSGVFLKYIAVAEQTQALFT